MIAIQFDLFEENSEISILNKKVDYIARKDDNVRRGIFARYSSLCKIVERQQEEIDELRGMVLKMVRLTVD